LRLKQAFLAENGFKSDVKIVFLRLFWAFFWVKMYHSVSLVSWYTWCRGYSPGLAPLDHPLFARGGKRVERIN